MPQFTETTDYEALFRGAGALDGEPGSDEIDPDADANIGQPAEEEEEPAAEEIEREPVAAEPEEEPEAELSPEEQADQEREAILAENQRLIRAQRNYEAKYGRPLLDPKEVQRQQELRRAGEEIRAETPALADGVQDMINDAVGDAVEQTRSLMLAETEEARAQAHDAAVTAMAPSYPDYQANPTPLVEWINELPAWAAAIYEDAFNQGRPEEVAGLINDFEAFPDPKEAAMQLESQRSGQPIEQEQEQPAEPSARRQPPRSTRAPVAALEVRSRGSRPLPTASSAPVHDEFDAAYQDWGEIERQQAQGGR